MLYWRGGLPCLIVGRGICNSIYVDNLVHAIYLAATQPTIDREIFLLGDQECVTWADLYRPIAKALGYELADLPEGSPFQAGYGSKSLLV